MDPKMQKELEEAKSKNLKRFTEKELEKYKALLLTIRAKIAGDLRHLESESLNSNSRDSSGDLSGYSLHMADMASDSFDRELALGLASNEQNLLNLVDDALRKFGDGTFGLCEKTWKPISKKRLNVMPYARLSLEAQELEEKEKRNS